ncbi:uncharacterized protein LOC117263429 [Epinephelus lanceolatus]|uniref:gastrula zinc finger protein XlCGF26.1-like n=1 Tax=Epinephelus lanceolatus TaxID=310571 RepID=UPI0014465BD7|nr:gastrula zinc finger protein XlCGF26.1-like [Epinephelus lanceolatus]
MSNVQVLRELVKQRLTAAAEEIFGLFDRTIAEYEEELSRSKEENERQQKLLDAVLNPQLRLHRADAQQLLLSVVKEEGPTEQQEGSLSQEPETPHIKEEQEGEQLQGLEEADIKLTFPVKSEDDDEEKAQSSQLHESQTEENREAEQLKTGADGEDWGGPVPARKSSPDSPVQQPAIHDKTLHSSESETDDSRDWEETKQHQSHLNPLQNNEVSRSDVECNTEKTSVSSSKCTRSSGGKGHLQKRTSSNLVKHIKSHTGEKPFSCSVCRKKFTQKGHLIRHSIIHTGEKPFSCSICGKGFTQKGTLKRHSNVHSGEKLFSCSVCCKTFAQKETLSHHLPVHTEDKQFTCSICKKMFTDHRNLKRHLTLHTGEKPFSCLVCDKKFAQNGDLRRHSIVHTGEKPFSCSVCEKSFTRLEYVKNHKCAGESRNK